MIAERHEMTREEAIKAAHPDGRCTGSHWITCPICEVLADQQEKADDEAYRLQCEQEQNDKLATSG